MEATVCSDKANHSGASQCLDRAWCGHPKIKENVELLAEHLKHDAMQIRYHFSTGPEASCVRGTAALFSIAGPGSPFWPQPRTVARQRAAVLEDVLFFQAPLLNFYQSHTHTHTHTHTHSKSSFIKSTKLPWSVWLYFIYTGCPWAARVGLHPSKV